MRKKNQQKNNNNNKKQQKTKQNIETVGELYTRVSLFGCNGPNFRHSRNRWSCDISRSEFYFFLVADTNWKRPLSFVSVFRAERVCILFYVNLFPTKKKTTKNNNNNNNNNKKKVRF